MSDFDKIGRIYCPMLICGNIFVIYAQRENVKTINKENVDSIFAFNIVNFYKK